VGPINMKYTFYIILIFFALSFNAQENWNSFVIGTGTEIDKENKNLQYVAPTNVALFSQIDLSGQSSISILYVTQNGDSNKALYSADVNVLRDLAIQYSHSEIINDVNCDKDSFNKGFFISEDKSVSHFYEFSEECNLLTTNCGEINFDIRQIENSCDRTIEIKKQTEYFDNKNNFVKRLKELSESENIIFIYDKKEEFLKGTIEFDDVENVVHQILKNSFWLEFIADEPLPMYSSLSPSSMSKSELVQTGKILHRTIMSNYGVKVINGVI